MTELITIKEVAPILRIKPVTVRRLIKRGDLPFIRIGNRYVFSAENLAEFIARNKGNSLKEAESNQ